ncbi:MAG: protein kinase, partial [Chloroflexi bacterium]|nr:protein kinase [Chloroflexota bacterium]
MPLINNRYDLQDMLGAGGMGEVFRARDILTGETVALKRVTTDPERLMHGSRSNDIEAQVALAQEFQTLASLRHPNIISVLDYGFDVAGSPYLTMPLIHNARKITTASRHLPTDGRVKLIIDMLQAVAYLHRRGILHRDLKPGNVLVTPDNDVKVLDFGLAVHRDAVEESGGTLFYMAPEVITGSHASEASDLYSVGVIAFEVLTGELPFNSESMNVFLRELFAKNPDLSLILQDTLPAASLEDLPTITLDQAVAAIDSQVLLTPGQPMLAAAIGKMLAKFPDQRYRDATSVIRDLSRAIQQPVPEETAAIRDSYLQAATFVGRQVEKQKLQTAIHHVMDKQGSLWLIGGESGVGKSRLVNEVRTHALVLGAQVVRGQEVENASLAFQVWRDVLPTLILNATIEDQTASVLKELVPTIEQLVNRPIADATPLPGNSGRERLVLAIVDVLKAQAHPVIVILEDLQWSTVSLSPLEALQDNIQQLPIIILGTFRDDERPELPHELPDAQKIILERLAHRDIVALTESMLGGDSAQDRDLMAFIERESEGNTYFMVEVVRSLAEELGSLSYIQGNKLPTTIETSGIQLILQRRLKRVPAEYHSLLQLAAVVGRAIEPDLLHYIEPDHSMQGFLFACNDAGVMTVEGNRWQFSHDKLRAVILDELSDKQRASLSRNVALAIEALHADDEDYLPALAKFWREAGDETQFLDCAIRAADYLV